MFEQIRLSQFLLDDQTYVSFDVIILQRDPNLSYGHLTNNLIRYNTIMMFLNLILLKI